MYILLFTIAIVFIVYFNYYQLKHLHDLNLRKNNPKQCKEITENARLDISLIWAATASSAFYIKGFATKNNTLGYEPIAYNRKSSSQFNKNYGEVAIGFLKFW